MNIGIHNNTKNCQAFARTFRRYLYVGVVSVILIVTSTAYAVEPDLVDNTEWDVGAVNDSNFALSTPHPTPWIFEQDGTVSAAGYWTGVWASAPGSNVLKVVILTNGGGTDIFEVKFLTPTWFVATKNGKLYRVGKRL
jgi:hypothetical protein